MAAESRIPFADVKHIDLALSGGGFRATLFHLGLVGCLRDYDLLKKTRTICSVSGGSILAAHMVIRWPEYAEGDVGVFQAAATHLASTIATRDISGEVLEQSRSRLLRLKTLDTEHLASLYGQFLHQDTMKRWDDLAAARNRPSLHILATHLNTGRACAFSVGPFRVLRSNRDGEPADIDDAVANLAEAAKTVNSHPIARAVAASSAFPPVFAPLLLDTKGKAGTHLLTDGGVYDNSGVNYLKQFYENGDVTGAGSLVIVSDAGRAFPTSVDARYDGLFSLAFRVTDAQGNRIAKGDSAAAQRFFEERAVPAVSISIHDDVTDKDLIAGGHSAEVQELVRGIRTELDKFSAAEILSLYRHGYLIARQALTKRISDLPARADSNSFPWTPIAISPDSRDGQPNPLRLSSATKDALEMSLKSGHVFKKADQLTRRAFRAGLLGAAAVIAVVTGIGVWQRTAGYQAGQDAASSPPLYASVTGPLRIARVEALSKGMWAFRLPLVMAVTGKPEAPKNYFARTVPLGSLSGGQPHKAVFLAPTLSGPLADAQIFMLLEENDSAVPKYVALGRPEADPNLFGVAAGAASDVLCLVITTTAVVSLDPSEMNKYVTIEVREP